MRKEELKKQLKECRFEPVDDSIFPLLEEFLSLCRREGNEEELAMAYFLKGEASFRLGIYEDTVGCLNRCLEYHTGSKENIKIEASAYNLLGLIFSLMGHELSALKNYFSSIDISMEHEMYAAQAITYMNIGWLYRNLGDYGRSMGYYEKAFEAAENCQEESQDIEAVCNAYRGQLYYKLGEYEKAVESLRNIEKLQDITNYCEVPVENLGIQVYHYLGDMDKVREIMAGMIKNASTKDDFLEQFEFYADTCSFALEKDMREEARQLLDGMENSVKMLDLAYVKLRIYGMEVQYKRRYSTFEQYLLACHEYMATQQKYQVFINRDKLVGMQNIENFRKVKREKEKYKEISRHDEMTGLLNKNTLEMAVSEYMKEAKGNGTGALLLIDLDHFKIINDTAGHLKGDVIIRSTAEKIREVFSQFKFLGRVGGDEFVVFIPNHFDRESVVARANTLCRKIREIDCTNEKFAVSISVGVAFLEPEMDGYEQLFEVADKALYQAKDIGRGRVYLGN